MKLAIMQPYLFPYIGYFQLIHAVDKFICYDDVNYIKQGWINRNRLIISGNISFMTVPLKNASSFLPIHQIEINQKAWQHKWLKSIEQSYRKSLSFEQVFPLIEQIIFSGHTHIAPLAVFGLRTICDYLAISTEIVATSVDYHNQTLRGEARVLDICRKENCSQYLNLPGGMELYSKENFLEKNINLHFLQSKEIRYPQFNDTFIPWLSIIDVLMHNPKNAVQSLLTEYYLL